MPLSNNSFNRTRPRVFFTSKGSCAPVKLGVMPLLVMNVLAILFEVMDKEPSLLGVWLLFLFLGVGGFLLSRYRYWLLLVALSLSLLFVWVHLGELHDPFVGPDIVREAGQNTLLSPTLRWLSQ